MQPAPPANGQHTHTHFDEPIVTVTIAVENQYPPFNYINKNTQKAEGWDYDTAAIEGTSFLVLPAWLNWFTANIACHHIHHLSASIPNYRLAACHREHEHLFARVTRVRLGEIPRALSYILWDTRARRIVSVEEFESQAAAAAVPGLDIRRPAPPPLRPPRRSTRPPHTGTGKTWGCASTPTWLR